MFRTLFFLLGITALLVASCRKDDIISCDPQAVVVPETLTLARFRQRNGVPTQQFVLHLGQSQTITTSGGAQLTFPANSYRLPSGAAAADTARLLLREIYTVPDMVLSNLPTGSRQQEGHLLISSGEFNIRVMQGGVRLRLDAQATVELDSPPVVSQDTTLKGLWKGVVLPPDTVLWQRVASVAVKQSPQLPFVYASQLPLDSISYWNIDQLWSAYAGRPLVWARVVVPAADESLVFLRPVGYNGLYRLYSSTGTSQATDWLGSVPPDVAMDVVGLQVRGGQLYYGVQRITTQVGIQVPLTLTAVSETEAVRLIRQL